MGQEKNDLNMTELDVVLGSSKTVGINNPRNPKAPPVRITLYPLSSEETLQFDKLMRSIMRDKYKIAVIADTTGRGFVKGRKLAPDKDLQEIEDADEKRIAEINKEYCRKIVRIFRLITCNQAAKSEWILKHINLDILAKLDSYAADMACATGLVNDFPSGS